MIRNIKSPSQTDLVFIHCHLNPPGASQTKITLLSLVTLKYNLKFCMKAAAAGLAAWAAGSENQHKKWRGAKCQHSTFSKVRGTVSPCLRVSAHCLQCVETVDISPDLLHVARPGGCVPVRNPHGDTANTREATFIIYLNAWSLLLSKWILLRCLCNLICSPNLMPTVQFILSIVGCWAGVTPPDNQPFELEFASDQFFKLFQ